MPINICQDCWNEFSAATPKRKSCYGQAPALKTAGLKCNPRVRYSAARKTAMVAVAVAIRQRRLVQQACEACGNPKSEAHHDDYAQPLAVRWLCRSHHQAHHNQFGPGANA